ncbi:shikimate dehydrogenase [Methanosarcinales archaeon ex4484_138]|nr:MAG: shikimate dehydrogenase [Methanosarcinales archaeon ex4484_138]RLG27366.1 MAG: shikimate dehydrogenase [Methanosarcinales archaeon]
MEEVFGVFGDPVEHSLSPVMHNAAISALGMKAHYHAFRVCYEGLGDALLGARAMGFGGVNLTIPLKERAFTLGFVELDSLSRVIGAVNTVDFRDGIRGFNTDGLGALRALEDASVSLRGKSVVLLGAGGAARAIAFQFASVGARVLIVNRTGERGRRLAEDVATVGVAEAFSFSSMEELLDGAHVLVNATSVGMHPLVDRTLVTGDMLHPGLVVFDIVYNPLKTRLILEAEAAGARIVTGEMMLVYQGAEAFRIWTGVLPPVDVMKRAVLDALGV